MKYKSHRCVERTWLILLDVHKEHQLSSYLGSILKPVTLAAPVEVAQPFQQSLMYSIPSGFSNLAGGQVALMLGLSLRRW